MYFLFWDTFLRRKEFLEKVPESFFFFWPRTIIGSICETMCCFRKKCARRASDITVKTLYCIPSRFQLQLKFLITANIEIAFCSLVNLLKQTHNLKIKIGIQFSAFPSLCLSTRNSSDCKSLAWLCCSQPNSLSQCGPF